MNIYVSRCSPYDVVSYLNLFFQFEPNNTASVACMLGGGGGKKMPVSPLIKEHPMYLA